LAADFTAVSGGYEHMTLEGCTEAQSDQARAMARVARNVAGLAANIGDLVEATERRPQLRTDETFRALQDAIEQFDRRRQVLRQELDRMTAANP